MILQLFMALIGLSLILSGIGNTINGDTSIIRILLGILMFIPLLNFIRFLRQLKKKGQFQMKIKDYWSEKKTEIWERRVRTSNFLLTLTLIALLINMKSTTDQAIKYLSTILVTILTVRQTLYTTLLVKKNIKEAKQETPKLKRRDIK